MPPGVQAVPPGVVGREAVPCPVGLGLAAAFPEAEVDIWDDSSVVEERQRQCQKQDTGGSRYLLPVNLYGQNSMSPASMMRP